MLLPRLDSCAPRSRRPARKPARRALGLALALWTIAAFWPLGSLAQPALFPAQPTWSTTTSAQTRALAVGDVDANGLLDLVQGNFGDPSKLFLNRGTLDATPAWTSTFVDSVTSAALGDIDGDGWIDLILSTWQGDAALYLNDGGRSYFPSAPSERLPIGRTDHIALGDLDGDGDLDLVAALAGGSISIYTNLDRRLEARPAWSSVAGARRFELADVNRDGRLDLVTVLSGTALHRGVDPWFEPSPSWESPDSSATCLALGDLDGDGDYDLVTGGADRAATRIYENLGSTFGIGPAWSIAEEDSTVAVALGDADADGDLDLACGNIGRSRVYRNDGGLAGWQLAWTSPGVQTKQIAWADFDGDGQLDLVQARLRTEVFRNLTAPFASAPEPLDAARIPVAAEDVDRDGRIDLVALLHSEGPAALYRGEGSAFEPAPSWSSEPSSNCRDCALGDVDGDGDPDLVCAGEGVALYLWEGTSFGTRAWFADLSTTSALAVGDVDGDADLDLVTGSSGLHPGLRLFLNDGSGFGAAPDWSDSAMTSVESVALGDVDGDVDLDLVIGSAEFGVALALFDRGGFGLRWTAVSAPRTHRVALDDVDGDGLLDLLAANDGFSALYTNFGQGEHFPPTPTWSLSVPSFATDVAAGDIDADGDLDVVFAGSFDDPVFVVANQSGVLADTPVALPNPSTRVLLRDVDEDGDLDLLGHRLAGTVELYRNRREPAFRADPKAPVRHLPDNPPVLRSVRVVESGVNKRRINLTAIDVESDSLWIVPEFSMRGSRSWKLLEIVGTRGRIGPVQASPPGVVSSFDWDLSHLAPDTRPVMLRFRTMSHRPRNGREVRVASYHHDLPPIVVQRPALDASPTSIEFESITVGDTAITFLYLRNVGNQVLRIEKLEVQNLKELEPNPQAPLELNPGQRAEIVLRFTPTSAPRPDPLAAPSLTIQSNDPANPVTLIELSTTVHPLAGRAQALVTTRPTPLGQPVVVQFLPEPFVRVETATMYFAPIGGVRFASAPMALLGSAFIASIPGLDVTELGVQFYVRMENSGVSATDPPGAPDSIYTLAVAPPTSFQVIPQPTQRADFLAGRDINVQVVVPQGATFVEGTLHYRVGGDTTFATEPVLPNWLLAVIQSTIPAPAVDARGIEYWIEIQTQTQRLVQPEKGRSSPDSIRTLVPLLAEPRRQPAGRYRMLSVPLDFESGPARSLDDILSDQPEFGPYDPAVWRAFRFLGAAGNVERTPDDPNFTLAPGRAFWLISRAEHRVDTAPLEGLSVQTGKGFPIVLEPGWNQIGHPYAFPVAWASVVAPPGIEPPVAFDPQRGSTGGYSDDPASVLEPFQGYFVWNGSNSPETLVVRPVAVRADTLSAARAIRQMARDGTATAPQRGASREVETWTVRVGARTERAQETGHRATVVPGALGGLDALDCHDPPPPPGDWLRVGFALQDARNVEDAAVEPAVDHLLRRDVRPPDPEGHTWCIELCSSRTGEEIIVDMELEGSLPEGFELLVVDPRTRARVALVPQPGQAWWMDALRLLSSGAERPYRVLLLAGTPEYLARESDPLALAPARVVFEQNEPNPFNGRTRIRFGLPEPGRTRLEIYDVRGRRLAVLVDRELPAGWQSVLWDGRDGIGHEVASGVYVARLVAPGVTLTRRMAFLK